MKLKPARKISTPASVLTDRKTSESRHIQEGVGTWPTTPGPGKDGPGPGKSLSEQNKKM